MAQRLAVYQRWSPPRFGVVEDDEIEGLNPKPLFSESVQELLLV